MSCCVMPSHCCLRARRADTGIPAFLKMSDTVSPTDDHTADGTWNFCMLAKIIYRVRAAQTVHESGLNHASVRSPVLPHFR